MIEELTLGLDAWIIQDGNYKDFNVGDAAAFAIEFWSRSPLGKIARPVPAIPSALHVSEDEYEIRGEIVHLNPEWWVIDIGIPVFQEEKPPSDLTIGNWVTGTVSLGIDPFFYFERLAKQVGAPAMIFEWRVLGIEMQTAPFVEKEPRVFVQDETLNGWKLIARTDAWSDDDGHATYLLRCRRGSPVPRRTLW